MKKFIYLLLLAVFLCGASPLKSQVLISLLFGEALNTPKIEFGLIGGWNRSNIYDIEESEGMNNFNLGFYFHIAMLKNSYLSTGVLVKSTVGATGMPTYPTGDPEFDDVYENGTLTKQINYFQVPILFQQRFFNRWYIEAGPQVSLRNKAYDIFDLEDNDGKLSYKKDVRDEYIHLDAGLFGGIGYKFKKEQKSMAVGISYYYGLVNVSSLPDTKIKNSVLYLYMKVPIQMGAGKKDDK